jgi:hypothetical protein
MGAPFSAPCRSALRVRDHNRAHQGLEIQISSSAAQAGSATCDWGVISFNQSGKRKRTPSQRRARLGAAPIPLPANRNDQFPLSEIVALETALLITVSTSLPELLDD